MSSGNFFPDKSHSLILRCRIGIVYIWFSNTVLHIRREILSLHRREAVLLSILIKLVAASVEAHALGFGRLGAHKVRPQLSLAFDIDESPAFTRVSQLLEYITRFFRDLCAKRIRKTLMKFS